MVLLLLFGSIVLLGRRVAKFGAGGLQEVRVGAAGAGAGEQVPVVEEFGVAEVEGEENLVRDVLEIH